MSLHLPHPDPFEMGPFCRLRVVTTAPHEPGVYAWVADGRVYYVGKAVLGFGLIQRYEARVLEERTTTTPTARRPRRSRGRRPVRASTVFSTPHSLLVMS